MKLLIKNQTGQIIKESPLKLAEKLVKIGRAEGCDIVLKSPSLSREHAQLQLDPEGRTCLLDLQSTFGTRVNGKRILPGVLVQIQPGDTIQLSSEIFMFLESEGDDTTTTTTAAFEAEDGVGAIFPFFMVGNERFVRDSFKEIRTVSPKEHHSAMEKLEESMADKVRELSAILEVSFALNAIFNYQKLLEYTIDMALKVTGAERGFIMLHNEEADSLETVTIRRIGTNEVERDMNASSSLVVKCFKTGQTLVIGDTSVDLSLAGNKSILLNCIRSVAVTPLRIKNTTIGVLYLDNRQSANVFSNRVQDILKVFAAQASVAIHNARLFHMATTDGLTGLTNHKHFQQRLLEEFCRASRYQKPLGLLMIDIDHFKNVNDAHGHQTGDQVLLLLSRILRANLRIHDVSARYGGEEFAILLPETTLEGAQALGEKLRIVVEQTSFPVAAISVKCTISIGVAATDQQISKPSDLVRVADQALYRAKEGGRNLVLVGTPTSETPSS